MALNSGDTVTLREVIESDLETFFEHQREPAANAMAAFAARERDAFFAHWHDKVLANASAVNRTILCRGSIAGNIACFHQAGRRLIGYWIGKAFWNRGIATRALSQFLEQVTDRPLHAFVATTNVGSIRVLEKCGFTLVGEHEEPRGDDGVDEHLFVLT